jgi:hypothetical protein
MRTAAIRIGSRRTYKDPDWSPDGREIVVVRGESLSSATESNDLYVLDLSSGANADSHADAAWCL